MSHPNKPPSYVQLSSPEQKTQPSKSVELLRDALRESHAMNNIADAQLDQIRRDQETIERIQNHSSEVDHHLEQSNNILSRIRRHLSCWKCC